MPSTLRLPQVIRRAGFALIEILVVIVVIVILRHEGDGAGTLTASPL